MSNNVCHLQQGIRPQKQEVRPVERERALSGQRKKTIQVCKEDDIECFPCLSIDSYPVMKIHDDDDDEG